MTDLEILQLHFSGWGNGRIARKFGVSRAAIWYRIEKLRDPVGVREERRIKRQMKRER